MTKAVWEVLWDTLLTKYPPRELQVARRGCSGQERDGMSSYRVWHTIIVRKTLYVHLDTIADQIVLRPEDRDFIRRISIVDHDFDLIVLDQVDHWFRTRENLDGYPQNPERPA